MSENPHTPKPSRSRLLLPVLLPIGILAGMAVLMILFAQILLNTSSEAATFVALIVSVAILVVGGVAASRSKLGVGSLASVLGVVAGVAMVSGAIALAVSPPGEHGGEEGGEPGKEPFRTSIVAGPNAVEDGFDPSKLTFESDVPIELEFDNQEAGVPHNVEIFDSEDDPSGPLLFSGEQITGVAKTVYEVEPLREGVYFFNCVVHPGTMTGQVTVETDASTGGTLAQTVVAQDTQFDTDELDLEPDTESAVTLENKDPLPHNLAIYVDDSLSETLFQGETFAGPASEEYVVPPLPEGEYYFQCDVHPTMAGQVVVAPAGGDAGGGGSGGGGSGSDEGG